MKKFFAAFALAASLTACTAQAPQTLPAEPVSAVTAPQITASTAATLSPSRVAVGTTPAPQVAPQAPKTVEVPAVQHSPITAPQAPKAHKPQPKAPVVAPVPVQAPQAPQVPVDDFVTPCKDLQLGDGGTTAQHNCTYQVSPQDACFEDAMAFLPSTGECVEQSFWKVTKGLVFPPK